MYLQIKVLPKSRDVGFVEKMDDDTYKIRLRSAPQKGRANEELIEYLADNLNCNADQIFIISGHTDRRKLVKVPDNSVIPW
jgi:uncharacterized protein (TIGR00251 family)